MKKMLNISFGYAIAAMAGGVFYREFTKFHGFSARTSLGLVHTHLFLLGMTVFLLAALFCAVVPLEQEKRFRVFLVLYNIGVPLSALMLLIRGIPQVLGLTLSSGADAAISGIAGIGHMLVGAGIVFFFLALRACAAQRSKSAAH